MSNIIEFPIGRNYASYWTVVDGIRELYANMLDYAKMNPNAIEFHYDSIAGRLHLANIVEEPMAIHALVLGNSNKASDEIGRFGEGMKMAYLALLREGREVKTFNVNEVWAPEFRESEQFGVETLCVEISESSHKKMEVRHVIEVTEEEVRQFMEDTITFHKYVHGVDPFKIETEKGTVLLGATMNGHIYVGGLLVTRNNTMTGIGIDVHPQYAKLGRDRKSIDTQDETLVYEILGDAIKESPAEMLAALRDNYELRGDIISVVGLSTDEVTDTDDDTVKHILSMRRLRDSMMEPLLADIEKKLANGAKYIVSNYVNTNCMKAVGQELFITVPYGMSTALRNKYGLPSPLDDLRLWFTHPAKAVEEVMADESTTTEQKVELIGKLATTWSAQQPWNL